MVTAIVAVAIALLVLALVVAVALDHGPPPADVAFAYEQAWDHFDFSSLWALSADELRDGLGRKDFVAVKTAAYANRRGLGNIARTIAIEDVGVRGSSAVVRTRVELHDGDVAHNEIHLVNRAGRWVVVEYRLRPDAQPARSAGGPADPAVDVDHERGSR
ncbi:MAG: hypothetical protein WD598_03885 [Acidimicrobiia bacterium]